MLQGFEDCRLLDQLIQKYGVISVALKEFSAIRNKDAEAICDLAMYNYLEVRPLLIYKSDRILNINLLKDFIKYFRKLYDQIT
jgi:kynurenine 3-monooxygenase